MQFQAVMGLAGNFNVYDIRKEVRFGCSRVQRTLQPCLVDKASFLSDPQCAGWMSEGRCMLTDSFTMLCSVVCQALVDARSLACSALGRCATTSATWRSTSTCRRPARSWACLLTEGAPVTPPAVYAACAVVNEVYLRSGSPTTSRACVRACCCSLWVLTPCCSACSWTECDMAVNADFHSDFMLNYDMLLPPMLADGVRIMIYIGMQARCR